MGHLFNLPKLKQHAWFIGTFKLPHAVTCFKPCRTCAGEPLQLMLLVPPLRAAAASGDRIGIRGVCF